MPAKTKITREAIIDAAFGIVRKGGWAKLSARAIAKELKSSTMPIYSKFRSMTELDQEVVRKIMALLEHYESKPRTGISPLDRAIGYILFAWKERDLFAAINDKEHIGMQVKYGDAQFQTHVDELSRNPRLKGLSREQLTNLEFLSWVFVHGIASMKNWMDETQRDFTEEKLVHDLREALGSLTYGFIQRQSRSSLKGKQKMGKKTQDMNRRITSKSGGKYDQLVIS